MNYSFKAYLDDFNIVTLIIPKNDFNESLEYFFMSKDNTIKIDPIKYSVENEYVKVILHLGFNVRLGETYYISTSSSLKSLLLMGKVSRSDLFDKLYSTNVKLGVIYNKEYSCFRLWSPYSNYVNLNLYNGSLKTTYEMKKIGSYFEAFVNNNLENYEYNFETTINNELVIVNDPYSYAINETTFRSVVVNTNKLYSQVYKSPIIDKKNTIIYETNIRDFTSYFKDDLDRSTYTKFYDLSLKNINGNSAGLKHIIDLGITHIELMPINLYYGIDYFDRFNKYNWGYNPINYFSFTNNYSINLSDSISRINEVKELIDNIHKNNLKVILDCVYNHVNKSYEFEYEKLVPGYSFNYDSEGMIKELSGCENDLNTKRIMIKKLIIDNLLYLVKEFNVDGFRFDLMGLIDSNTINEAYNSLKLVKNDILMFGEGWIMDSDPDLSNLNNKNVTKEAGFFNDYFRDNIKEFILGRDIDISESIFKPSKYSSTMTDYNRIINYLECHDDYSLIDYLKINCDEDIDILKERALLGISLLLISSGIPFIHSGMEFYNDKSLKYNTYNLGDEYNFINWDKIDDSINDIEFIKELIKYRKEEGINITNINRCNDLVIIENNNDIIYVSNNFNEHNIKYNNIKIKSPYIELMNNSFKGLGIIIVRK